MQELLLYMFLYDIYKIAFLMLSPVGVSDGRAVVI